MDQLHGMMLDYMVIQLSDCVSSHLLVTSDAISFAGAISRDFLEVQSIYGKGHTRVVCVCVCARTQVLEIFINVCHCDDQWNHD